MTVGELQKKLKPLANDLRIDIQHQDVGGHGDITFISPEHYEGSAEIVLVLYTDHWRP